MPNHCYDNVSPGCDKPGVHLPPHMKPVRHGKAGAAAFIAPVAFMALHFVMLSVMSYVRLFTYLAAHASEGSSRFSDLMRDVQDRESFMALLKEADVTNYASFYAMIILIPVYLIYFFLRKKKGAPILLKRRVTGLQLMLSAAVIFAAMGLTQLWMMFLEWFSHSWPWLAERYQTYLTTISMIETGTSPVLFQLLVIAVLVPVGEELLFRGIVQGELRRALPPSAAVIVTALLFSVFHFDFVQSSYVIIAGLALSVTYELTGRITVPLMMHMLFNLVGSGLLSSLFNTGETLEQVLLYVMFGFVLPGIAALIWLKRLYDKKEKPAPSAFSSPAEKVR